MMLLVLTVLQFHQDDYLLNPWWLAYLAPQLFRLPLESASFVLHTLSALDHLQALPTECAILFASSIFAGIFSACSLLLTCPRCHSSGRDYRSVTSYLTYFPYSWVRSRAFSPLPRSWFRGPCLCASDWVKSGHPSWKAPDSWPGTL